MPEDLRRVFEPDFKIHVVDMYLSGKFSTKQLCEMYDLDRQTIHRWKQQYQNKGRESFTNKSVINDNELTKLRRELDDLRMENEILKKANAYFAQKKKKK